MFDKIAQTNEFFDNVIINFDAFNKSIDVVAFNKNFSKICRE